MTADATFQAEALLREWLGDGMYRAEVFRWTGERDFDEDDVGLA